MSNFRLDNFEKSLYSGFIDESSKSELLYQPELLVNKKDPQTKVLSTIISELEYCESFFISVAFVTTSGVASIINSLILLEEKGVRGKIVVSQYLNFTQPEALKRLAKFTNIELRIATNSNSHSKGYIFKNTNYYNLIIGSSNLTATALSQNKEWNLKVSALHSSKIANKVIYEFESDFNYGIPVTEQYISDYSKLYESQRLFRKQPIPDTLKAKIVPNSMQIEALGNLEKLRNNTKSKALLISATGTGKTFLSAFDAKTFNPKKLLFIVHRLNIAKKAMETFQSVFGTEKTMGLYSGNHKELEKDFIFSTVQTLSKQENLNQFESNHFDYIIIDESHRSGANSYQRLINHFNPSFLLGMTATPERTDGNDIFSLFDHNIAYEIRLSRALDEEMLSPFHYYGVTDLSINDELIENKSDFNLLTADERVKKIITKATLYGSDNGITRGLIFCSRKEEAITLSSKFNLQGLKTIALTGDSSEIERKSAIDKLESDDINERVDYIFTVDIFNEGIDIPRVNQIIMMRPTESSIIFIQQLGRGLRKTDGKDYVTIIDFIGNYNNNYLIPIALYGDTSFNKDSLRKLISEGSRMIPGSSTINFDEITKEKIFNSIDSANMQLLADLKKDYNLLKYRLGRTPMMVDFLENNSRDPFLFVNYSKSYYNFVLKADKSFDADLDKKERLLLELFGREINNGKRVEESIILKELLTKGKLKILDFKHIIKTKYNYSVNDTIVESCLLNLNFSFIKKRKDIISIINQEYVFHKNFSNCLKNITFKHFLLDSINYSIKTFNKYHIAKPIKEGFILYNKYSRKDVFRILNFSENPVPLNVGGYMIKDDKKSCPLFVNYQKEEGISESTKYDDKFINSSEFEWWSKNKRNLESNDVQTILGRTSNIPIRLPLFVKKNNDESKEFYFIGDTHPDNSSAIETTIENDEGKEVSIVRMTLILSDSVPEDLYNYITSSNDKEILKVITKNEIKVPVLKTEVPKFFIPYYDFYAAAGSFSEMHSEKEFELIKTDIEYNNDEYFACQVIGESMNRRIPNGSICLFRKYAGGSRNGKIILVENSDIQDPDFNSAFTVKTYNSTKSAKGELWEHNQIVLSPNSTESDFKDLIIDEENAQDMRIVGEFIKLLS